MAPAGDEDGEEGDDRPFLAPGEVVYSEDGSHSYRVEDLVGEGRCCMVYSAHSTRDNAKVALKFYRRGPTYDGAIKREQYILDLLKEPHHRIGDFFFRPFKVDFFSFMF